MQVAHEPGGQRSGLKAEDTKTRIDEAAQGRREKWRQVQEQRVKQPWTLSLQHLAMAV